jgi:hypothetical protein
MRNSAPNMARQLLSSFFSSHMQYRNANVMPLPRMTAASGAKSVFGSMLQHTTSEMRVN